MTTETPTIPQTPEWLLLCEAVHGKTYDTLSSHQKNVLLQETFDLTDAYGGDVPLEWDWSGCRDSSPAVQTAMGQLARQLLTGWGKMPEGF